MHDHHPLTDHTPEHTIHPGAADTWEGDSSYDAVTATGSDPREDIPDGLPDELPALDESRLTETNLANPSAIPPDATRLSAQRPTGAAGGGADKPPTVPPTSEGAEYDEPDERPLSDVASGAGNLAIRDLADNDIEASDTATVEAAPEPDIPEIPSRIQDAVLGPVRLLEGINVEALREADDHPTAKNTEADQPPEYDLRKDAQKQLAQAIDTVRETQRANLAELGQDLTREEVDERPLTTNQINKLREMLEPLRKRIDAASGVALYLSDQQREALQEQGITLTATQQASERALLKHLLTTPPDADGGLRGVIISPAGSGKTGVIARYAAGVKHYEDSAKPHRVLVLEPTRQLRTQTAGLDGDRGFGKFADHLDVGIITSTGQRAKHSVGIMSTALFDILHKTGRLGEWDTIIVDEAHLALGTETSQSLREYTANRMLIGLTATGEYSEEHHVGNVFGHTIYHMNARTGIEQGILAPTAGYVLNVTPNFDQADLPEKGPERRAAIRQAYKQAWEEQTVELIRQEVGRGFGVMVRCAAGDDVRDAVDFAARLNEEFEDISVVNQLTGERVPFSAWYAGGKRQSHNEREQVLRLANQGAITVLCYVKGVGTGTDVSRIKAFIDKSGGTTSRVEGDQNFGRAMRLMRHSDGSIVRGEDGQPVPAHVYVFANPWLGDRQYTPLHMLGAAQGELVTRDTRAVPPPVPQARTRENIRYEASDITTASTTELLDFAAIQHSGIADQEMWRLSIPHDRNLPIAQQDAQRMLGIEPALYNRILGNLGFTPGTILTYGDIEQIYELYPGLQPRPFPAGGGYVNLETATKMAGKRQRQQSLLHTAWAHGVHPEHFIDHNGRVDYYFKEEVAHVLARISQTGRA